MRTTALLLAAALALTAAPVRAEDVAPKQERGFLSGLGLGLLIGGLAGVGVGFGGLLSSNDAFLRLGSYTGTVTADEAVSVTALQERMAGTAALSGVGFVVGGLALAGGVTCLLLDAPRASVAFVPSAQGGVLVFSGRF